MVLDGEAGIGKTRLVTELVNDLTGDARLVLIGHCSAAARRHLAFGPWIGVLRDLVQQEGRAKVVAWAGPQRWVLAHLHQDLADPESNGLASPPTPGQVYEAVTGLLTHVAAQRPTVLVLEDLHWSDASSRDLLDYLVRVVRRERLLVVVTVRTGEPGAEDVQSFLTEFTRLPQVSRVEVPRFVRGEVAQQMTELLGTSPSVSGLDQVMSLSEGVPFLVEEAVAADVGGRTSPGSFATDLVGHRLSRLERPGRDVVDLAAVGQDPLFTDLLARACASGDHGFDVGLRQAVDDGVLEMDPADPTVCRFRHALLREAARDRLLPGQRVELNRRWATVLAESDRLDPATRSAALASHWIAAGEVAHGLVACLAAADEAQRVAAYPEQARWLDEAAGLWHLVPDAEGRAGLDHLDLLAEAGEAMYLAGRTERAEELVDAALNEIHTTGGAQAGWLHVLKLWIADRHDRPAPVADVIAVVSTIPSRPPTLRRARAADYLGGRLTQAGRPEEGLRYADEATQVSFQLGNPGLRCETMTSRAIQLAALRRDEEAVASLAAARQLTPYLDLRLRSDLEMATSVVLWMLGLEDFGISACRRGVEMTGGDRPGPLPTTWGTHSLNLVEGLFDAGSWDEAGQLLDRVEGAPGVSEWIAGWADRLGWHLAAQRGELGPDGWRFCGSDRPELSDVEHGGIQNVLANRWTRADVAALAGRVNAVRETLRPVLEEPRCVSAPAFLWPILEVAARVESDASRHGAAEDASEVGPSSTVVDQIVHLMQQMPPRNPRDAAFAANVSADLARSRGVEDVDAWAEVVGGWRQVGIPHRVGWTSLRLAEAAVAQEDRAQARDALLEALSVAQTLGARPMAEAARVFAHRHRITLPPTPNASADSGPLGLTERELQVLALLADGSSNQEIATRLFISPKTASVHVSHILAKLGVTTRTHAAAVAHRSGLAEPRADDPATV